jgi:hypothetical protein
MKNNIFFLILMIVFFACDKQSNSDSNKKLTGSYKLEKGTEQSFLVPPSSTNFTKYLQYYAEDGDEYLVTANLNNFTIEVYSFSSGEIVHEYKLPMDGKFSLQYPQLIGFHLINFDSVYVNAYNRPLLLLLDKDSRVIHSETVDLGSTKSTFVPLTGKRTELVGNKLILGADPSGPNTKKSWSYPLYYTFDLKTRQWKLNISSSFVETDGYYGAFHSHHAFAINHQEELMIHNITYDQNLYIRSLHSGKVIKKIAAPSKYFSNIPPWKEKPGNEVEGHEEFYIENNSYKSILWDPYRKVYYRFAERGVDRIDLNGQFNTWYDKLVSVMILNEDFEKIGETDLEQSRYRISNSFVGEDGLYISTSNEKNPDYNEDFMRFDIYKLSKE